MEKEHQINLPPLFQTAIVIYFDNSYLGEFVFILLVIIVFRFCLTLTTFW